MKMNIDDHPSIPGQLGIQSIPAVIAFRNGQPVDGFMGAIPESQIREFIERIGGKGGSQPEAADALKAAAEAREAGDAHTAAEIYSAIVQEAPDNVDAIAALADLLFEQGDADGAEEVLAGRPKTRRKPSRLRPSAQRWSWQGKLRGLEIRMSSNGGSRRTPRIIRHDLTLP